MPLLSGGFRRGPRLLAAALLVGAAVVSSNAWSAAAETAAADTAVAESAAADTAVAADMDAETAASPLSLPASGPKHVVGLGDSVPAGTACGCTSYVAQVAQEIGRLAGVPVRVDNLARGGATMSDVLGQLVEPGIASRVADADVVIITVGANDLDDADLAEVADAPVESQESYRTAMAAQRRTLAALLDRVNELQAGHKGRVLVTGYWNVFLDGEVARSLGADYVAGSDAVTRAENALIAAASALHGDDYVDLYALFKGDGTRDDAALLAPDGDHPNAAGHALIARTLLDVVL